MCTYNTYTHTCMQDNYIEGVYLAGITQELFDDYREAKYQMAELRLSIYGRYVGHHWRVVTCAHSLPREPREQIVKLLVSPYLPFHVP